MTEIMGAGETSDPKNQERCIRQSAVTAAKNVKCPLSQLKEDRCIAGTVSPNIENRDSNFFGEFYPISKFRIILSNSSPVAFNYQSEAFRAG